MERLTEEGQCLKIDWGNHFWFKKLGKSKKSHLFFSETEIFVPDMTRISELSGALVWCLWCPPCVGVDYAESRGARAGDTPTVTWQPPTCQLHGPISCIQSAVRLFIWIPFFLVCLCILVFETMKIESVYLYLHDTRNVISITTDDN